jgi:hypothetical protein
MIVAAPVQEPAPMRTAPPLQGDQLENTILKTILLIVSAAAAGFCFYLWAFSRR